MPFVENGRIFDASVVHCRMEVQLQFDKEVSMQRIV